MSFETDLNAFADKVIQRTQDVFVAITQEVKRSVVEGSEITGAPGQPVDVGTLKGSWIDEFLANGDWQITTNLRYARSIEEGLQPPYTREDGTEVTPAPMTRRSEVGGFHSVALTRAGFGRIVEHANRNAAAVTFRFSLDTRRRP